MVRRARHNKQALQWHSNQETPLLRGQEPLDGNVGVTDLQPEYAVFDQASGLTCFVLALGSRCSTPTCTRGSAMSRGHDRAHGRHTWAGAVLKVLLSLRSLTRIPQSAYHAARAACPRRMATISTLVSALPSRDPMCGQSRYGLEL